MAQLKLGTVSGAPAICDEPVISNEDKTITSNGTYTPTAPYTGFGTVTVQIPSGTDLVKNGVTVNDFIGDIDSNGVLQPPSVTSVTLTGFTDVASQALEYTFKNCKFPASINIPSLTTISGSYGMRGTFTGCSNISSVNIPSLTTISGESGMASTFYNCSSLSSVDVSSLETVNANFGMDNAFSGCSSLTTIDLSKLNTVSGNYAMRNAFDYCTSLTSLNFPALTTVSGTYCLSNLVGGCTSLTSISFPLVTSLPNTGAAYYLCSDCTNLESVNFQALRVIGSNTSASNTSNFGRAFSNCSKLVSISFPSLEAIYCTGSSTDGTFQYNNKVQKFYFPKLNTITYGEGASSSNQNACKYIFYNCTSLTELHFAAANEAAIKATSGYATKWGAPRATTIYFDL